MNYLKALLLMSFSLCTMLCVAYAHSESLSESAPGEYYQSHNIFMPNCNLVIEHEGTSVNFRIPGNSNLIFRGFWPKSAGDVQMSAVRQNVAGAAKVELVSGTDDSANVDQTLLVRFSEVNGGVHPTAYVFRDLETQRNSKVAGLAPKICVGLRKVR